MDVLESLKTQLKTVTDVHVLSGAKPFQTYWPDVEAVLARLGAAEEYIRLSKRYWDMMEGDPCAPEALFQLEAQQAAWEALCLRTK